MKKKFYCLIETNFCMSQVVFTYYGTKSNFNRKAKNFIYDHYGRLFLKSKLYLDTYDSFADYLCLYRKSRIPYCPNILLSE
nr:MAG TPA: hypothetical protein [Microviridae sp.]